MNNPGCACHSGEGLEELDDVLRMKAPQAVPWIDRLSLHSDLVFLARNWRDLHWRIPTQTLEVQWGAMTPQAYREMRLQQAKDNPRAFLARYWPEQVRFPRARQQLLRRCGVLLEASGRDAQGWGCRFLVVFLPEAHRVEPMRRSITDYLERLQGPKSFEWGWTKANLRRLVLEGGMDLLEAVPPIDRGQDMYIPLDGHLNARGWGIVAEQLARRIQEDRPARPDAPGAAGK